MWIGPRRPDTGTLQVAVAEPPRSVGSWKVASHDEQFATLTSNFEFPVGGAKYLQSGTPTEDWAASPWAFDKAYLVLIFKNEGDELGNNFVPDNLVLSAQINGTNQKVYPFKTKRYQAEGLTRCYFLELPRQTRTGQNTVSLRVPIQTGIAFQGAYLDLPDQMP